MTEAAGMEAGTMQERKGRGYRIMRVLVATEDGYGAYREAIAAALQYLHPNLEVSSARTPELYDAVSREAPHVVICDRAVPEIPGSWLSWVHLCHAPDSPSKVSVRGISSETINPGLKGLLSVIERTEEVVLADPETGAEDKLGQQ
jgi:hypothetical protein